MATIATTADSGRDGTRITLRALIAARWVLLLILVATDVAGRAADAAGVEGLRWSAGEASAVVTGVTVVLWAALNLATRLWIERLLALGNLAPGLHLVLDTVGIALLLAWSGGGTNPFTILFFVPITLATQVSPRWTWIVAGASVLWFGGLLLLGSDAAGAADPAALAHQHMGHAGPAGGNHYEGHLRGMWLALGLSGALITYFVHRIAKAISAQRAELARLRDAASRDRELGRIGSLAAGAAHELGTPLATLAVLAGEIDRMGEAERHDAAATMRSALVRCKDIISSMATPELRAGTLGRGDVEPWSLQRLDDGSDPAVRWDLSGADRQVSIAPPAAFGRLVGELIANAKAASPPGALVYVRAATTADRVELAVADQGAGMTPDVAGAATAPFFSTKQGLGNMGLGLFLVEAQVRTLGGELTIDTRPAHGTTITIALPRLAPAA